MTGVRRACTTLLTRSRVGATSERGILGEMARGLGHDGNGFLAVPESVARSAEQIVTQAFERFLSSGPARHDARRGKAASRGRRPLRRARRHDPAVRQPRDADRAGGGTRSALHPCAVGARRLVDTVRRCDGSGPARASCRCSPRSSRSASSRRRARCRSQVLPEVDPRALPLPAQDARRLGSSPAARTACATLDREWRARSRYARQDREGPRQGGEARPRDARRDVFT